MTGWIKGRAIGRSHEYSAIIGLGTALGLGMVLLLLGLMVLTSGRSEPPYNEIPIPDRKINLTGLQMITTRYLDEHPDDFQKFIRILTEADDALQENPTFTRGTAIQWIKQAMKREQVDETMPIYLFLKNVYLHDWEGSYLRQVSDGEREYLYDLIGATIGGMYRCSCAPPELRTG
jgi:hypothetical protein